MCTNPIVWHYVLCSRANASPDLLFAAQSKQQLRLGWRFQGEKDWQVSTVETGYVKGQLAIRIKDGEYAGEVAAFPQPGVEYSSAEILSTVAAA